MAAPGRSAKSATTGAALRKLSESLRTSQVGKTTESRRTSNSSRASGSAMTSDPTRTSKSSRASRSAVTSDPTRTSKSSRGSGTVTPHESSISVITDLPRAAKESTLIATAKTTESARTLKEKYTKHWSKFSRTISKPTKAETTSSAKHPKQDYHLRILAEEMADCVRHTSLSMSDTSWSRSHQTHYKEVHATNGYIEGQWKIVSDPSRNKSHTVNESLGRTGVERGQHCCALRLRVPKGLHVAIEFLNISGSFVRLYDTPGGNFTPKDFRAANVNYQTSEVEFVSYSNIVNVMYFCTADTDGLFLLKFKSLQYTELLVNRTAFNRGVVRTARHHVLGRGSEGWAYINVPFAHLVLVSVPRRGVRSPTLALLAADRSNATLLRQDLYTDALPAPTLHNTALLLVRTIAYAGFFDPRFRVLFSFQAESAPPRRLDGDSSPWNCSSATHRSDLLFHLSCNVEAECDDAADETGCAYSSERCGPGYLSLGGACYFYLRRRKGSNGGPLRSGADVCAARGERLAVLDTVAKWEDAARLLPSRKAPWYDVFVHVGISSAPASLPLWYKDTFLWDDGSLAYHLPETGNDHIMACRKSCGILCLSTDREHPDTFNMHFHPGCVSYQDPANVLCEKTFPPDDDDDEPPLTSVPFNDTDNWPRDQAYVLCPLGHYTHTFLACDAESSCWSRDQPSTCESPQAPFLPVFTCRGRIDAVPYTLVCDYRADCFDSSDEDFCSVPPCRVGQFSCKNGQCVPSKRTCDGWEDCYNGEDEAACVDQFYHLSSTFKAAIGRVILQPPALVNLSENGRLQLLPLNTPPSPEAGVVCPDTHFQCLDNGHCLPVFLRCNGVYDCPGREDEVSCHACPGLYRCRASAVCVRHSDLCDGHAHCPQHDDEAMCNSTCPASCLCSGLAFFCGASFTAWEYPLVRYLDAGGSDFTPAALSENVLLIRLILTNCSLTNLEGLDLPNLLSLDVENNRLSAVREVNLIGVPQLRELSVAGNPLTLTFEDVQAARSFPSVLKLDLSRVGLHVLNTAVLSAFPSLEVLNLSHSGLERILGEGFSSLGQLRVVDVRGCPMTWFPRGMLQGLRHLEAVHAENFKVCCPAVLPQYFSVYNCFAPSDEISSCSNLLREIEYRVCVFTLSVVAVLGNSVSFVFRTCFSKRENNLGFGNFVRHLSLSDLFMGVYLAIIGVADQVYHGTYLWNDVAWRHSATCSLAGFLSLLSCEVSALIMCLITVDRFLVLRFPFSRLHFGAGSAHMASAAVSFCGIFLASVPLLPVTSHWEFYSQTGICLPLPVTRDDFAGYGYSFSILIVFNFVLFLIVSLGQLSIYWSVRANSMPVSNTTKKASDLTIARRLITVAMTDFLCWFPVGVLGLMVFNGAHVPRGVNVGVAVFVLPLNSAVNPCLYTFNVIQQRRRLGRNEKLRAVLLAQLKAETE